MRKKGVPNKKPKTWETSSARRKNHALAAFRKVKKAEKEKKILEQDRFNNLCGEVTITKIAPTMSHLLEARLERQAKKARL